MGMGFEQYPEFQNVDTNIEVFRYTGSTVRGIDVSYYQGTINWTTVYNSGIRFAFARVTYGKNTIDSKFDANWSGMKAAGVIRGAYHFYRPSQDPTEQANVFLAKLGTLEAGDMPPVRDIEVTESVDVSKIVADIQVWLDVVEEATGRTPIIIPARDSGRACRTPRPSRSIPLGRELGRLHPALPSSWSDWTFWQYSATGTVSGITGAVDMDYFKGTLSDLSLYIAKSFTESAAIVVNTNTNFQKPFTRILSNATVNMTGSDVKLLQLLYNDWAASVGYSSITADGEFGNGTQAAIVKFQTYYSLTADGVADSIEINKLVTLFVNRATYYSPYTRTLKVASPMMNGTDVKYLQTSYNTWATANGVSTITADGYYGSLTKTAVTAFQNTETALLGTPDGITGRMTQRLLFVRTYK
jgi:lysozyme